MTVMLHTIVSKVSIDPIVSKIGCCSISSSRKIAFKSLWYLIHYFMLAYIKRSSLSVRDGSRAAATSKMEWFVILVYGL